jgi:Macrocin-O-methyltransferase (TylF)
MPGTANVAPGGHASHVENLGLMRLQLFNEKPGQVWDPSPFSSALHSGQARRATRESSPPSIASRRIIFIPPQPIFDARKRASSLDWPQQALVKIGRVRLQSLRECHESVLRAEILDDLADTGIHGGMSRTMTAVALAACGWAASKEWPVNARLTDAVAAAPDKNSAVIAW